MPDPSRFFPDQIASTTTASRTDGASFDLIAYLFSPPNPPIPPSVDPRQLKDIELWQRRTPAGGIGVNIRYTDTLVQYYRGILPPEGERPKRVVFSFLTGHRGPDEPIAYFGRTVGQQLEPQGSRPSEVFAFLGRKLVAPNPLNKRRIEVFGYRHSDPLDRVIRYGLLGIAADGVWFHYEWDFVGRNSWAFDSTDRIINFCLDHGRPDPALDEFLLFRGESAPA